jgi:putative ABC transport system permease protein
VGLLAANLRNEVAQQLPTEAPDLFFIDIQPQQREPLAGLLAGYQGAELRQLLPSLRARVLRIAGRPATEANVAPGVAWTVSRDRGLTYAATMPAGSELLQGAWWPADYQGPPLLSVDEEIANGYRVGLGDTIAFNVLGRTIEARIANIRREVDWSGGRLDFLFVLNPGALAGAPHTFVASADVPAAEEADLLNRLATALPNVTPISLRDLIARAIEVLGRVELAVRIVAGLTLGGGVLALAGGIAAARERQRYETVLLKVLGARRPVLIRAFLVEYLVIGVAVALVGGFLGSLAAWLVVTQIMHLAWVSAPLVLAGVVLLTVGATLVVGAAGLWRLVGLPPAAVLRYG